MRQYFSKDPTARGDEIAEEMRDYYDMHRTPSFMERIFGRRSTRTDYADGLMLGLLNTVLEAQEVCKKQDG
jgi:hypothetical protein